MTETLKPETDQAGSYPADSSSAAGYALGLLDVLASNRRQIVRVLVAALIAFTVLAFVIPKRYEATARLMPPDQAGSSAAAQAPHPIR